MNKVISKIKLVEDYIEKLIDKVPDDLEGYKENEDVKRICERYFEMIIESITNISFMLINLKKYENPIDDADALRILSEHKIIDESLAENLRRAKGMRNIIVHQYDIIDDDRFFDALKNKLEKDVTTFIKEVKKCL